MPAAAQAAKTVSSSTFHVPTPASGQLPHVGTAHIRSRIGLSGQRSSSTDHTDRDRCFSRHFLRPWRCHGCAYARAAGTRAHGSIGPCHGRCMQVRSIGVSGAMGGERERDLPLGSSTSLMHTAYSHAYLTLQHNTIQHTARQYNTIQYGTIQTHVIDRIPRRVPWHSAASPCEAPCQATCLCREALPRCRARRRMRSPRRLRAAAWLGKSGGKACGGLEMLQVG